MRLAPIALLLTVALACAEFEPLPEEALENAVEPVPTGPALAARERLVFRAYLLGIPAGRAEFTFERDGDIYKTTMSSETTGIVSLLYGASMEALSVAGAEDTLSRRWSLVTTDGDEVTRIEVRFQPETGRAVSVVRGPKKIEKKVAKLSGALDPLASLYAIRRAPLNDGDSYRTTFFSRRNPYRADSLVQGRESVQVPAGTFDSILVRTDLRREKDGKPADEGSGLGVYVTDDPARIPVRIDVDTKYGRVSLRLAEIERDAP